MAPPLLIAASTAVHPVGRRCHYVEGSATSSDSACVQSTSPRDGGNVGARWTPDSDHGRHGEYGVPGAAGARDARRARSRDGAYATWRRPTATDIGRTGNRQLR